MENQEVIKMQLDIKQINNLCTGVKLAIELETDNCNLRKFLTIQGYRYNNEGNAIRLKKVIDPNILDSVYFELKCYEISIDYYINHWDVTEDDLTSYIYKDDIKGIDALESELKKYMKDFSELKPEWYCDNLL